VARSSEREDLFAEATALVERVSIRLAGNSEPTVVGFRRDGSASFYLDPQRVYQFNAAGQLRRAHFGEQLLKAERGGLIALDRRRSAEAIELVRHALTGPETEAFLSEMRQHLRSLNDALAVGQFEPLAELPAGAKVIERIRALLASIVNSAEIATSPRVG
jgi:hypothetical protein